MEMTSEDIEDLKYAKHLLENPGLAAKITNLLGTSIEKAFDLLPAKWSKTVQSATRAALEDALKIAVSTMKDKAGHESSEILHKCIVAASGAAGGAFGLAALTVELPLSTAVILRSIADIARSEGERVREPEAQLACLEVFALGSPTSKDDATETGYFVVRAALARAVTEAAEYIVERGLVQEGAPAIVRFIARVASRFSLAVSQKVAAQAVPLVGAAGGALINTIFIDHFQSVARGHFIVRRLERNYDPSIVKGAYLSL